MQKLQCELCHSIDFIRTKDGFFQCQHCGCKYTLEQARTILTGAVEVVAGEKSFQRQLEILRTFHKLGDRRYLQILKTLEETFPDRCEVWIIKIETILEDLIYNLNTTGYREVLGSGAADSNGRRLTRKNLGNKIAEIDMFYQRVVQTATDEESITQLNKSISNTIDTICDGIQEHSKTDGNFFAPLYDSENRITYYAFTKMETEKNHAPELPAPWDKIETTFRSVLLTSEKCVGCGNYIGARRICNVCGRCVECGNYIGARRRCNVCGKKSKLFDLFG